MVLLVAVSTYILVYRAYGFGVDTNTGEVTQQGLVFIDSAPDGARINIDGKYYDDTNKRISLNEGTYNIEIIKTGYISWTRQLSLQGGEVVRLTYPALFPSSLQTSQLRAFDKNPDMVTQSPDMRWVVLGFKNTVTDLKLIDLNKRVNGQPVFSNLDFVAGLFTAAPGSHKLKTVEWSSDNKHLLVKHSWPAGSEFLVLDRENPVQSFNLTAALGKNPTSVAMIDKSYQRLFVYSEKSRKLEKFDVEKKQLTAFGENVISYQPHGKDRVLLSRAIVKKTAKAEVVLIDKGKQYLLRRLPAADKVLLKIASYDDDWFAAVSLPKQKKTYIYKNPEFLNASGAASDRALEFVLRSPAKIDDLSFSDNARFISIRAGKSFSVYDVDKDERFYFELGGKLSKTYLPEWMDGHCLIYNSNGLVNIIQFDGTNRRKLIRAEAALPAFFDKDYTELYTFDSAQRDKNLKAIFTTQLRLPGDK